MPFCDAMELYEYWNDYPPLHVMVRNYLGYESRPKMSDPMEIAATVKAVTGSARARKLSTASRIDQERFAALKKVKRG